MIKKDDEKDEIILRDKIIEFLLNNNRKYVSLLIGGFNGLLKEI